jgi:WD40 repeat protein
VPEVHFWDVATGKLIRELKTTEPEAGFGLMANSADCNTLAVGMSEAIRIWDVPSGASSRRIPNRGWWGYQALAISPDGRTVAASIDDSIGLWETDSGKPLLQDYPAHRHAVRFVACTPDNRLIITAGYDGLVMAWDAETGRQLYERSIGLDSQAFSAALSPDGEIVAAAGRYDWTNIGDKNVIRLWKADSGEPLRDFGGPDGPYRDTHDLAFSPDGKLLAIAAEISRGNEDDVDVCDIASGEVLAELRLEEGQSGVAAMAFSPDSKSLYVAYHQAMLHVWDLAAAKVRRSFVPHLSAAEGKADPKQRLGISEAVFTPDAKWLIACQDGSLVVWEVATGKALWTVPASGSDRSMYLGLSPDGRLLATSKRLDTKKPDDMEINLYAIDPKTGNIRLWNPDPGWSDWARKSGDGRAISLAFSPNDKRLITGMDRGTILVWDIGSAIGGP